jgi:5-methylcytosine-specific restriction endonuclease McrA
MRVPRAVITSAFYASDPPLPPLRRIIREAGADVLRRARKLPPSWRRFVRSKRFTRSRLWSRLRYDFLRDHDGRCQCCGRGAPDGDKLNVDHVLSRKTYPQFALAYANLQVLCSTCNQGKGNRDRTDWRFRVRGGRTRAQPITAFPTSKTFVPLRPRARQ